MLNIDKILIILLLLVIGFFVLVPSHNTSLKPDVITKIETFYKHDTTIKYHKGDSIPFVVLSENTIRDTIHDTIFIVKDYLSMKVFTDTFSIDSSKFMIIDTISHNTIQNRRFLADIHQKTIRITNTIYHENKPELYWGIMGIQDGINSYGIGAGIIYKSPNRDILQLNYTNTKQVQIGYYSKIF